MRHLSDANAQDGNFGTQIRSAIFWRSGSQIVSQVVSWTSTLIVARLLDPADYGLFAMTLVVLNFMGFMNGYGIVRALVQAQVLNLQQIRQALGLLLVLHCSLGLAQLFVSVLDVDFSEPHIVARLFDPAVYGLFAMTLVVLNFMGFMNGYGLVSALVQAPVLNIQQIRQAFGLMLVLNGGLALAQLFLAGIAADYYGQPMVANLLRVQALIYLSTPFISLPEVLIGRSLNFKAPAFVNILTAMVTAVVSLTGALLGWGVWTLVFAPVLGFWVKAVGNMIATRFFVLPSFNFRGTGGMVGFGASLLGSQLLIMVQSQSDILIGGRMLSPHELGLYSEALFLTQIFVSRFIPPLNDVAFPAYARMQADKSMLNQSFCKAVRLILLVACPLYLGMAVVAEPLIQILFGSKWLGMAPLVTILAASMPCYALQVLFSPALNALGLPRLTARISAIGALIMPAAFRSEERRVGKEGGSTF